MPPPQPNRSIKQADLQLVCRKLEELKRTLIAGQPELGITQTNLDRKDANRRNGH